MDSPGFRDYHDSSLGRVYISSVVYGFHFRFGAQRPFNIMSICNGSKKRNNKGNSSLSTAAVYPIIQTVQKEEASDDAITVSGNLPTTNGCRKKKSASSKVFYGQKVEPQAVP